MAAGRRSWNGPGRRDPRAVFGAVAVAAALLFLAGASPHVFAQSSGEADLGATGPTDDPVATETEPLATEPLAEENFDALPDELGLTATTTLGTLVSSAELRAASLDRNEPGNRVLWLAGGDGVETTLQLKETLRSAAALSFWARRDGRRQGFRFEVTCIDSEGVESTVNLRESVPVGDFAEIRVPLLPSTVSVRLRTTTPPRRGLYIDDLRALPPMPMVLKSVVAERMARPILDQVWCSVASLVLTTDGTVDPLKVDWLELDITGTSQAELEGVRLVDPRTDDVLGLVWVGPDGPSNRLTLGTDDELGLGTTRLEIQAYFAFTGPKARPRVAIASRLWVKDAVHDLLATPAPEGRLRAPHVLPIPVENGLNGLSCLTSRNRDGVGELVLVASFAEGSGELLTLRSTDVGATWEQGALAVPSPPKGAPDAKDGTISPSRGLLGSPTLVGEPGTQRMHLFASWIPAGTPGIGFGTDPESVPQILQATTEDAGRTWGGWVNLTSSLRDPNWSGLAPAGGRGTSTFGGTLVVPLVARLQTGAVDAEPNALVASSVDRGRTWKVGAMASPNTGSCAVVQLGDNAILLDAYDLRGRRRTIFSSRTDGRDWTKVLREAVHPRPCGDAGQALVHVGRELGAGMDGRLLFMNAASWRGGSSAMTLRGSNDSGGSWTREEALVLDDGKGVGFPQLALLDKGTVAAIYQTSSGQVVLQELALLDVVQPVATFGSVTGR